jgi:hypothetical protein
MRHRPEFPDIAIPSELGDWSTENVWGNDLCVRLTKPGWSLWVDHEDPEQRETGGPRFAIHPCNDELDPTDHAVCFEALPDLLGYIEAIGVTRGVGIGDTKDTITELRAALRWALGELEEHECYPTLDREAQEAFDTARALAGD